MMIHEAKIEYCVVAEHTNGDKFCMAKFMYEEDAREYMKTLESAEWREWKLYERRGDVVWKELE